MARNGQRVRILEDYDGGYTFRIKFLCDGVEMDCGHEELDGIDD